MINEEIVISEKEFKALDGALSKLFKKRNPLEQYTCINDKIKEFEKKKEEYIYATDTNIFAIEFKNIKLNKWFKSTFEFNPVNKINLDYSGNNLTNNCNYGIVLLTKLLRIFNSFKAKDIVTLSLLNNYPLLLENDFIKVILAPKMKN